MLGLLISPLTSLSLSSKPTPQKQQLKCYKQAIKKVDSNIKSLHQLCIVKTHSLFIFVLENNY